jgi:hypothetical protein
MTRLLQKDPAQRSAAAWCIAASQASMVAETERRNRKYCKSQKVEFYSYKIIN